VSTLGGSRHVVVKVVRPQLDGDAEFETMFLQEGRVALGLKHPNICHVYEVGQSRGRCFIAMEYVHGVTLNDLARRAVKEGVRVPTPILVKIAAQVAEALHSAHTAKDSAGRPLGIVHRDVSPHNIMIGYDGVVKLLDFGVARARGNDDDSGTIKGKLGYLAPEQCVGKPMDARADVFALGVCLWESMTGKRLFKRGSELETLTAIVKEDVPDPGEHGGDASPELAAIIRRALAKSPEDRWPSAEAMEEALEGYLTEARQGVNTARIARFVSKLYAEELNEEPTLDRRPEVVAWIGPPSVPPPALAASAPKRRSGVVAIAIASLALVFGGGAFVWQTSRSAETLAPAEDRDPVAAPPVVTVVAEQAPSDPAPAEPETVAATVEPAASAAPSEEEEVRERRRARREAERFRRNARGGFVDDPGF
jgi:serine/threonine-protein kinase